MQAGVERNMVKTNRISFFSYEIIFQMLFIIKVHVSIAYFISAGFFVVCYCDKNDLLEVWES